MALHLIFGLLSSTYSFICHNFSGYEWSWLCKTPYHLLLLAMFFSCVYILNSYSVIQWHVCWTAFLCLILPSIGPVSVKFSKPLASFYLFLIMNMRFFVSMFFKIFSLLIHLIESIEPHFLTLQFYYWYEKSVS